MVWLVLYAMAIIRIALFDRTTPDQLRGSFDIQIPLHTVLCLLLEYDKVIGTAHTLLLSQSSTVPAWPTLTGSDGGTIAEQRSRFL